MKNLLNLMFIASFLQTISALSIEVTKEKESPHVIFYLKAKNNCIDTTGDKNKCSDAISTFNIKFKSLVFNLKEDGFDEAKVNLFYQANNEAQMSAFFANLFRSWPLINIPLLMNGQTPALKPFHHRVLEPALDVVIDIELTSMPSSYQLAKIKSLKESFTNDFNTSVGLTWRYTFLDKGTMLDSDYRIAFLVPWKRGQNKHESQLIWKNHHGPLALRVLPTQLKSYRQFHTEIENTLSDVFDDQFQGICFENVESAGIIKGLVKEKGAWKASLMLAADEEKFIGHPSFLILKPILK